MEFDLDDETREILIDLLRNWGPQDLTLEQEEKLDHLADLIKHCGAVGSTLHLN